MPRYQDIARQLKTVIEQGKLKPGARLPSSRTWSQELGVSRSTVENAYAELVAQGWLVRRGQAGTFVSEQIHPQQSAVDVVAFAGESQQPLPFQMGLPALDLFPRELWARVMGRRLRTQTRFDLALGRRPCARLLLIIYAFHVGLIVSQSRSLSLTVMRPQWL